MCPFEKENKNTVRTANSEIFSLFPHIDHMGTLWNCQTPEVSGAEQGTVPVPGTMRVKRKLHLVFLISRSLASIGTNLQACSPRWEP